MFQKPHDGLSFFNIRAGAKVIGMTEEMIYQDNKGKIQNNLGVKGEKVLRQ